MLAAMRPACVNAKRVFIFLAATRGPVRKIDARAAFIYTRGENFSFISIARIGKATLSKSCVSSAASPFLAPHTFLH